MLPKTKKEVQGVGDPTWALEIGAAEGQFYGMITTEKACGK